VSWRRVIDSAHIAFRSPNGKVTVSPQHGDQAVELANGLLVFPTADGTLMAAPFDRARLAIGAPQPVPLPANIDLRSSAFLGWAAAPNGTLVLLRNVTTSQLARVARNGVVDLLGGDARSFRGPRLSPDGTRIAVEVNNGVGNQSDLWIFTRTSQTLSRLTQGGRTTDPLWSRDGRRIAYTDVGVGQNATAIYQRNVDGSGAPALLVSTPVVGWPQDWAADGSLVYEEFSLGSPTRMKLLAPGAREGKVIVPSTGSEALANLSPDGRWIAYAGNETGRYEVYVSPFPGGEGRVQVSSSGGHEPVWARNGRELFYRDATSLVAATVQTSPAFTVTARRALFADPYVRSSTRNYDVFPDGEHFVMLKPSDEPRQFIVVTNWLAELDARMKSGRSGAPR